MKILYNFLLAAIFVISLLLTGCSEKKEKIVILSTVNTLDPSDVTGKSAVCGGDVTNDGGGTIIDRGICYSYSGEPTTSDLKVSAGTGPGKFTVNLTGLSKNKPYIYKAYSINEAGTSYGFAKTFTTFPIPEPSLTGIEDITMTSCTCYGSVLSDDLVLESGFCWGTTENPTIEGNHVESYDYNPLISFITGLQPGTLYHVRVYAKNAFGIGYSEDHTFTTTGNDIPEVETHEVTHYALDSVSVEGEVTYAGGSGTKRGILWARHSGINIANADGQTNNGFGAGVYEGVIKGTQCNTTYFARAYAQNDAGVSYGQEISFRYDYPKVKLISVENIGGNEATGKGEVLDDGGLWVIVKGYCWSTHANPTVDDHCNSSLLGKITGLSENTVYYVRAFAKNQVGIAYSNEEIIFNSGYIFSTQHQGGSVFYNDGTGHGLVCKTSQLGGYVWGCEGTVMGTSDSIGASEVNTQTIVSNCVNYPILFAAKKVSELEWNGYSDWVLPSSRALEKIYLNLVVTNHLNIPVSTPYWSSTDETVPGGQNNAYYGRVVDMDDGDVLSGLKSQQYYVLPVRKF